MKTYTFGKICFLCLIIWIYMGTNTCYSQVTPNASVEAKALLDLHYSITGKYTLTGQHNYPDTKNRNTRFVKEYTGETPVIWSSDFGFAQKGDKDSYLARPAIVKEAIRQHKKGSIITLCWHAVPPTADEPITFQPIGKLNPENLASVQGHMLNEQYKELLTPGTRIYNKWAAQVDTIARYLKMLQDAKVPVLWRPYHEMNGDWFWWGGRVGENSTADIYRQLFNRLVHYHQLNNLIWVWNVDRPSTPIRKFSNFYPGNEYLDIVSLDVYGSDFNQAYYDSLMVLAKGKPILFGEVGNPPAMELYKTQPNWTSWVIWAGMARYTSKNQYKEFYTSERMLTLDDKVFWEISTPYRKACNLPILPLKPMFPVNFSGKWRYNELKSQPGKINANNLAEMMTIDQDDELVFIKKFFPGEWGDDRIEYEDFYINGAPVVSESDNFPKTTTAAFNEQLLSLKIKSIVVYNREGRSREVSSSEEWQLVDGGKSLKVIQTSTNQRGEKIHSELVYERALNR